mgnify:CR=1 FL=1
MKPDKWKELVSLVLSFLLALALFLILLLFLHWNLILCMVPAAAAYIAFSLILRPVARIGKVEVESLANGEFLNERLTEAGSDYARMQKAVQQIREQPLLDECRNLMETASGILKYLTDNPEKIPAAAISTITRKQRPMFLNIMLNSKKPGCLRGKLKKSSGIPERASPH